MLRTSVVPKDNVWVALESSSCSALLFHFPCRSSLSYSQTRTPITRHILTHHLPRTFTTSHRYGGLRTPRERHCGLGTSDENRRRSECEWYFLSSALPFREGWTVGSRPGLLSCVARLRRITVRILRGTPQSLFHTVFPYSAGVNDPSMYGNEACGRGDYLYMWLLQYSIPEPKSLGQAA